MSLHSLEEERQEILARIKARRDEYRRMLASEDDVSLHGQHVTAGHLHAGGMTSHYQQAHNPAAELAWAAFGWARQHPLMCAAAIAAVVALGPRRIARTAISSGTALTAMTLRNPQNIDTLTRLISTVTGYMQRDRTRYPP